MSTTTTQDPSDLPINCRLVSRDEARDIKKAGGEFHYIYKNALAKKVISNYPAPIQGTDWVMFGWEVGSGFARDLLVTKVTFSEFSQSAQVSQ